MKKNSILLLALCFAGTGAWAQKVLTVTHNVEGQMASEITEALNGGSADEVTELVITGNANVTFNDCRYIRAAFTTSALKKLDLSQAKFENDSLPGIPAGQNPSNVGAFNATVPYTKGSSEGLDGNANGLLVEEIVLPNTLRVVGNRVFRKFKKLTKIVLPETVEVIDEGAFNACNELKTINFPDGLKTINDYAFYQCYRLGLDANAPVDELPEGMVGVLGGNAFRETSVFIGYIPEGITEIGDNCFNVKTGSGAIVPGDPGHPADVEAAGIGLTLTIYENVAKIGKNAFKGQKHLQYIEMNRMTPPEAPEGLAFGGITTDDEKNFLGGISLYVPQGTFDAYNAVVPYNLMNIYDALPPTGVNMVESADFSLYPTVADNEINIQTTKTIESIRLYNAEGRFVGNLSMNESGTCNVSHLQQGLYFIQINNQSLRFIKK